MMRKLLSALLIFISGLSLKGYGQSIFSRPLKSLQVNQGYGWRIHPVTGAPDFHNGTDLKADFEPVFSIADGEVIRADANAVSGKFIVIRHGKLTSHYAHLSSLLVRNQDAVSRGQLIGLSGNSGRTTGPHLHFALSYADIKIDAIRFFAALIRPDTVPP